MRLARSTFRVAVRVATRVVVAGAIDAMHRSSRERAQPFEPAAGDAFDDTPYAAPAPPVRLASQATAPPFDAPRARSVFAAIDMKPCAGLGFRGYARGQIVVSSAGSVRTIWLDAPDRPTAELQRCVFERVSGARFAPFAGEEVVVGTTWYVP
jgi:hypothetical protein